MSSRSSPLLTDQQKNTPLSILQKQQMQIGGDRAYYYTSSPANKWVELRINEIPKNDFQNIHSLIKQKIQDFKHSKFQPKMDYVEYYHKLGMEYLNVLTEKAEQILRQTALLRGNSTAQTLDKNMKKTLDCLVRIRSEFAHIERIFLATNYQSKNSNHNKIQNLDVSRNSSSSQKNEKTYGKEIIQTFPKGDKETLPEKTVAANSKTESSSSNTSYGVFSRQNQLQNTIYSSNIGFGLSTLSSNPVTVKKPMTINEYSNRGVTQAKTYQINHSNILASQNSIQVKRTEPQTSTVLKKESMSYTNAKKEQSKTEGQFQRRIREEYEGKIAQKNALLAQKQRKIESQNKQIKLKQQLLSECKQRIKQLQQVQQKEKQKQQKEKRNQLLNQQILQQQNNRLKAQVQHYRQVKESQTRDLKPLQDKIISAKQQLSRLQEESSRLKKSVDDSKRQLNSQKSTIELNHHKINENKIQMERLNGEVFNLNAYIDKQVKVRVTKIIDQLNSINNQGSSNRISKSASQNEHQSSFRQALNQTLTATKNKVSSLKAYFTESCTKLHAKSQQLKLLQLKLSQITPKLAILQQQLTEKQSHIKNIRLCNGAVMSYEKLIKQKEALEKSLQKQRKQMREDFQKKKQQYQTKIDHKKQQLKREQANVQSKKEQFAQILTQASLSALRSQLYTQKLQMQQYLSTLRDILSDKNSSPEKPSPHLNVTQLQTLNQQITRLRQLLTNSQNEKKALNESLIKIERKMNYSKQETGEFQRHVNQLSLNLRNQQQQLHASQDKIAEYEQKCKQYEQKIKQLEQQLEQSIKLRNNRSSASTHHLQQSPTHNNQKTTTTQPNLNPSICLNQPQNKPSQTISESNFKQIPNQDISNLSQHLSPQSSPNQSYNPLMKTQSVEQVPFKGNEGQDSTRISSRVSSQSQSGSPGFIQSEIEELHKQREELIRILNPLFYELKGLEQQMKSLKNPTQGIQPYQSTINSQEDFLKIRDLEKIFDEKLSIFDRGDKRVQQIEQHIEYLKKSASSRS